MKIFEYILKFGFMLGLGISLTLLIGPNFIKLANSSLNDKNFEKVNSIEINEAFDSRDYIELKVSTVNGEFFKKNYFLPENQHSKISKFLIENQIITKKLSNHHLPILIDKSDLDKYKTTKVFIENNKIKSLIIGEYHIIGQSNNIFRKIIFYVLGFLFTIIGFLAILLTMLVFVDNIKFYHKTGSLPSLPNSINSKIEGLKYIFRSFNNKTNTN